MKIKLDENNRVIGIALLGDLENSIEVETDIDIENIHNYKYINNEFVLDTEYIKNQEQEEIKRKKLQEAKNYLLSTDYIVTKLAEYQITRQASDKDYTEVLQKREEAREIIRSLEVKQ